MVIAQSFSKILGLYGERVGCLHFVCSSPETAQKLSTNIACSIRAVYSSPPRHGGLIAQAVLTDPELKAEWLAELKTVGERIVAMRKLLKDELEKVGAPGNWDHVVNQIGMFSYTGLTAEQSAFMVNEKHVYMTEDGRISVAGINAGNVAYTAKSFKEAIEAS